MKIYEYSRVYYIFLLYVCIFGRKCYYKKKNFVKYIFGILESKGLKLELIIIIWCFFFVEEKMLVWYWKENYYNYIYIKKRCGGIWNIYFYLN